MKTKMICGVAVCALLALGCARIRVEAPKEPIKVDISMRVDVYQHVQQDIDAIEDIVSGSNEKAKPADQRSMLDYFVANAYAQEALDPAVREAALRRKDRLSALHSLMRAGAIGENKLGLLEITDASAADASAKTMVSEENKDRMIIYQALAKKNNTTLGEIQTLYASRLQNDAPSGTPIEVSNTWQRK